MSTIGSLQYQPHELMVKKCCNPKRVTCFKNITETNIQQLQMQFYSLPSETDQKQYMLNYFKCHSKSTGSILYTVGGQLVCQTCFRLCYGIRYNRFINMKRTFSDGILQVEHGLQGIPRDTYVVERLVGWLQQFFNKVGDRLPMNSDIHLPSCLTKGDVYDLAVDDLTQGDLTCCSKSSFYSIIFYGNSNFQM